MKSTADMIDIGRDLIAVKDHLEHGQFTSWVETEIGISIRTVQGYIRFAVLAEGKSATVSLLPPSTVRLLAAKSAPPEIVEDVIARASSGDIVSDTTVKAMIGEKRFEIQQQAAAARQAERNSRRPKAVRERIERERREHRAEIEKLRTQTRVTAQLIIDRLAPADLEFLVDKLDWDVCDELRRLIRPLVFGEVPR